MKYVCDVCGWEYDEEEGEDFECPLCNVGKDQFSEVE
ncbi:MAG: rubredoxin [Lachnospiraceae bacterium]|nr:rubredoxin [Lachnospiraceae bacterium]